MKAGKEYQLWIPFADENINRTGLALFCSSKRREL